MDFRFSIFNWQLEILNEVDFILLRMSRQRNSKKKPAPATPDPDRDAEFFVEPSWRNCILICRRQDLVHVEDLGWIQRTDWKVWFVVVSTASKQHLSKCSGGSSRDFATMSGVWTPWATT
jgi:hypothetical protein